MPAEDSPWCIVPTPNAQITERLSSVGTYELDLETMRTRWSPQMFRNWDVDPEDFDGDVVRAIAPRLHPEDRERILAIRQGVSPVPANTVVLRSIHRDGTVHYLESVGQIVRDEHDQPVSYVGYLADVTQRHEALNQLQESEERYRLLAANSFDVLVVIRDDVIDWVSPSITTTLGWERAEWVGSGSARWVHPDDLPQRDAAYATVMNGVPVVHRIRLRHRQGHYRWVEVHAKEFQDVRGVADGVLLSFRDVDSEVHALEELERRASHDDLTGLLSRAEAYQRAASLSSRVRRDGSQVAVIFLDVDDMKTTNDSWGHAFGDALLRALAERVRAQLRSADIAARIGGDEMLVVLDQVHGLEDAERLARAICMRLREPMSVMGVQVSARVSAGVAVAVPDESIEDTIRRADRAMYRAKQLGGGCHVVAE